MEMQKITSVYFVGAGGIGMSALARYFSSKRKASRLVTTRLHRI